MSTQAEYSPDDDPEISALVTQAKGTPYTVAAADVGDPLWDPGAFGQMWRVAKTFAGSRLTPEHLRGKTTDVFLALTIARRAKLDPLVVLQSIYFVGGKPGWMAVYLIARAKQAGMPIRWTVVRRPDPIKAGGKSYVDVSVTAWAMLDGEKVEATITTSDAIAKTWTKSSQYDTSMELMLQYRTATQLVRLYAPDILLGLPVVEELEVIEVESVPAEVTRAKAALNRSTPARQIPEVAPDSQAEADQLREDRQPDPVPTQDDAPAIDDEDAP